MPEFDVGDTLSRQVGPLPVGGWLLAVAGGLGVAYMLNRDAPQPNPGTIDPGTDAGLGFTSRGGSGTDLLGPSLPTQPPGQQPAPDDDEDGEPTTNTAWGVLAIRTGMGLGYGPIATNGAVSRYLTGQELTREQANMLDAIIREIGPPPNPVPTPRIGQPPRDDGSGGQTPTDPPPSPTTPPPTPPPPSPPRTGGDGSAYRARLLRIFDRLGLPRPSEARIARLLAEHANGRTFADIEASLAAWKRSQDGGGQTYTIVSGDTLWGIAQRFYGNGSDWTRLWSANSSTLRSGNPNLIYPGERIRIP